MLIGGIMLGPTEVQISRLDPPSSHLPEAILAFGGTAIWGFLALVALIIFRKPIARFLSTVGGRLSKISIAGIELELAKTPSAQLSSDATSFGSMDSQRLANDSYSQTLKNALQGRPVPHSYAIIDLGTGQSWLISRLFIFAVMLRLVRGVRCFVFVSGSGGPRQYLGTIAIEDIRWTLARRYPWLERIFAKAYKDQLWQPLPVPTPPTPLKPITTQGFGMLDKDLAAVVAQEYGAWIDADLLLRDFDGVILTERIPQSTSTEEKVRKVVGLTAPYLAVVGDSGEFISLIERCKVLEELARSPGGQG